MKTSPRTAHVAVFPLFALSLLVAGPAVAGSDVLDVGDRRVVVAPLNLAADPVDELSDGVRPVWNELLVHLRDSGHRVAALEEESTRRVWREVLLEARAEDPDVGIREVYARFALRLAEEVDYGVLIFPSLVTRAARVVGETARWDGVDRFVPVPRVEEEVDSLGDGALRIHSNGGVGEIAAASLHVAVFDGTGRLRHEGSGGLTLLHQVERSAALSGGNPLQLALREDAFVDPEPLREGIGVALSAQSFPAARAD